MSTISLPIIPVRYFAILCEFLDSISVNSNDILRVAGLNRQQIVRPNQTITLQQMELLLDEAKNRSERADLAFELGTRIKLSSHDILSCALMSSVTLDQLLRLYSRFHRLISPLFVMHYQRRNDNTELTFKPAMPMSAPALQFWLETLAVSAHMQLKAVLQTRPSSYHIYLSMDKPSNWLRYQNLGLARFHFAPSALPEVRIQINDVHLDARLPMANALAVNLAEQRCKTLLNELSGRSSWGEWVRMMLQHAEDCQPTLSDLAKIVNVTSRTLDRHLHKENTSFRELSARVRNQRACEMLGDGHLSISQIAYTLGYTDISNFSRSFKKISGLCPSAYQDEYRLRPERCAA